MKLLRNKINPADRYAPADFFVPDAHNASGKTDDKQILEKHL